VALASNCFSTGSLRDASLAISDAMASARASNEKMYWPEILRLNAEIGLLNGSADRDGFEKSMREIIEMARRQEAKLWEFRATMSLSRFLASTGRRREAYGMISSICDWYKNSRSTPDLDEGRALRDELRD
jgi:hypothetical protein